jgi:hypothetical protein
VLSQLRVVAVRSKQMVAEAVDTSKHRVKGTSAVGNRYQATASED